MRIQIFSFLNNDLLHKRNGAVHFLSRGIEEYGDTVTHIHTKDPVPFFKKPKPNIIVIQGTFDDAARASDAKVRFRQTVKDYAYEENIPLLVLETNTVSRILEQNLVSSSKYHRIGFQHWLYRKAFFFEDDYTHDRWNNMKSDYGLSVTPWKNEGDYALLLLGFSKDPTNDLPPIEFCSRVIPEIRQHSDIPIVIRKHPLEILPEGFVDQFDGMDISLDSNKSILESLAKAKAAIMYNSTSIFQSVYAGVPVIVGEHNFASNVASLSVSEINNLKLFDQEEWFARMCHTEWTRGEMSTASFWGKWHNNYYRYKETLK